MKLFTTFCLIALTISACNPAYAGGRSSSGGAPIAHAAAASGAFTPGFPGFPALPKQYQHRPGSAGAAFPGFTGRKQFTENDVKTIVNYENGKVVSVVQIR